MTTRIYVPPRRKRPLPVNSLDQGPVMLGIAILAVAASAVTATLVWWLCHR